MAVQSPPWALQASSHGAELVRREVQARQPPGSAGGVVPTAFQASNSFTDMLAGCSDMQVNPGGGMSINVSPGACYVPGTLGSSTSWGMPIGYGMPVVTLNGASPPSLASNAHATQIQMTSQGLYYAYDDGSTIDTEAIATSNPSNPRIDVVVAQVEDAFYSGSNNDWKIAVITGTPAASPTVPSLPFNVLVLAYVWVGANVSSISSGNILDLRVSYNRMPFYARMYRNAAFTTAATGFQSPQFDTVVTDPTAMCTTGASAHFTIQASGLYIMSLQFLWNGATGRLTSAFLRNGGQISQGSDQTTATAVPAASAHTRVVTLNQGDTITPQIYTSVAAALGVAAFNNWAEITLLAPL